MDIIKLLEDKTKKPIKKRMAIEDALSGGILTVDDLADIKDNINEKEIGLILEAAEAVTNTNPAIFNLKWLKFAEEYVASKNNTVKREASRIIGNIAHLFPDDLESVIPKLIANAEEGGTVVRWSGAYALAKIILVPAYINTDLYDVMMFLFDKEENNGAKNQYLSGLKKAKELRKT